MSHILKATELELFAKFHDDWSKQSVSNATSPNYANYEVIPWIMVFKLLKRNNKQFVHKPYPCIPHESAFESKVETISKNMTLYMH